MFLGKPDDGYASKWSSSMEQCKNSHLPRYLLGYVGLNNPHFACWSLNYQFQMVWVGVTRQAYPIIDQGIYEILCSLKIP